MALVLQQKSKPQVLGIVNISPESFSYALEPANTFSTKKICDFAHELYSLGINILDIGAVSTRPGSELPDEDLELKRFENFFSEFYGAQSQSSKSNKQEGSSAAAQISVDCFRYQVLKPLLQKFPITYINDVSGFTDPKFVATVAEYTSAESKIIIMHSRGGLPALSGVADNFYLSEAEARSSLKALEDDLSGFFQRSIELAKQHGIAKQRLILDPGLGFAKNLKHSLQVLALIPKLQTAFDLPLLVGASRKSFLILWFEEAVARLQHKSYSNGLISALLEIAEQQSGMSFDGSTIIAEFFAQHPPESNAEYNEIHLRDKLSNLYNRLAIGLGADYIRVHNSAAVPLMVLSG